MGAVYNVDRTALISIDSLFKPWCQDGTAKVVVLHERTETQGKRDRKRPTARMPRHDQ
jgi:hypothetical protein